jgi:rhodanese-related sulfurtransferase
MIEEITAHDLKAILDQTSEKKGEIMLVDVRQPEEVTLCAITGSINIPLDQLSDHLDGLPSDKQLVMICHHGVRSKQAAILLGHCGFKNVASLRGGVESWAQEIDPMMNRY